MIPALDGARHSTNMLWPERHGEPDVRSVAWRRVDRQRPPKMCNPPPHAREALPVEAVPGECDCRRRREACAIIPHLSDQLIARNSDAKPNLAGLRVTDDIGEG